MKFSTVKREFLNITTGCLITAALSLACIVNSVQANDGITSNAIIHKAGLTVQWFTHSGGGVGGSLVDWYINVDENKSTTYFSISAGSYEETFSQNTLSPFGRPYGIDGAEEFAAVRKDVLLAELENDGITDVEVKIDKYTLPETTVYALTSNAVVKAIDGDTGATKWVAEVGDSSLPCIGVGASNDLVAAVVGTTVYCLEAETGKVLWTVRCKSAPSAAPSVSEGKIYVPLIDGRLETFVRETIVANDAESTELGDDGVVKGVDEQSAPETHIKSYAFVSQGQGTSRPLVTDKAVAWPTSKGDLNVAAKYGPKPGIAYQLRTDRAIVNTPAIKEGMFFVTSLDGFVYAVDEERGSITWEVSTGFSISKSPIPLGNYVFVINDAHQMFKFEAKTGFAAKGWEEPLENIQQFVGAGKSQMYLLDRYGKLLVTSQETGATVSSVRIEGVQSILPNLQSDRLYLASDRGMIQCVREIASTIPHFHSNEFVAVEVDPSKSKTGTDADGQPKAGTDLDDPFRTAPSTDNPFGGGAKPSTDDDNPFGGATPAADQDNPFGGTSAPDEDNPFK